MKKLIVLLLTILTTKIVSGQICDGQQVVVTQDGQCDYTPYVLEFEDNFNGNSLDLSKWQIQPWGQGALQGEDIQEYNSLDNVTVAGGICYITAKHETVLRQAVNWKPDDEILSDGLPNLRTYYYTSSNIWTKYKFGYGKFEIRCKLPAGKSFKPAFWMYGRNASNSSINNEIDVFEFWDDNTSKHHMTVHYNGQMCEEDYNGPDYSQDFHTFTVIWNNYKIEWYVDGNLKRRSTKFYTILGQIVDCNGIQAFGEYILDKVFPRDPMNIITNLAIQTGTYAPDNNTPFPSSLEIDYIRYYKQIPCAGEVTAMDITQLNLSNIIYNLIIGTTITIGGNVTIQSGQQLELVARDEIDLLPGFTAETGSNFVAHIDPTICAGGMKMSNNAPDSPLTNSTASLSHTIKTNSVVSTTNKNFKIKIYPNPNNGILSIEFEENSFENYELNLLDEQGKIIYQSKTIKESKIVINMNGFGKGIYVLNILDTKNKNAFVNKIIFN